jgi:Holliday junction resolvase RusA-like endonuclease
MEYKFTIPGRPIPKKNNPVVRVIPRRGAEKCPCCGNWTKFRFKVSQPKRYRDYESRSIFKLRDQKNRMRLRTIRNRINCKALFWLEDLRGHPDLHNLEEATADILQRSTVIADDNLIASWDGSKIMGVNRNNPRVEITIKEKE